MFVNNLLSLYVFRTQAALRGARAHVRGRDLRPHGLLPGGLRETTSE